jgi:hypothetical protein
MLSALLPKQFFKGSFILTSAKMQIDVLVTLSVERRKKSEL